MVKIIGYVSWAMLTTVLITTNTLAQEGTIQRPGIISLEEAVKLTLENNPDFHNSIEMIVHADAMVMQSWAIILPRAGIEYTYTENGEEVLFMMPGMTHEIAIVPETQESTAFYTTMSLIDVAAWTTIRNSYRGRRRTGHAVEQAEKDLVLAVTSAYYQVSAQEELIEVAILNYKNAEDVKNLTDARYRLGMNTRVDVLRSDQSLISADQELSNAKDALKLAKISLANLMGVETDYEIERPPRRQAPTDWSMDALFAEALANRRDYTAQLEALKMAETGKAVTAARFLPTVDVTYVNSRSSEEGLQGDESEQLVIGAQWTLVEGGSRLAQFSIDESIIRMEKNRLRALELDIKEEVERAILEIEKSDRNIELARKRVEIAEESYRSIKKQYEVGIANSLDLSDALTGLGGARYNLVFQDLMYDLAVLKLNRAVGVNLAE